MATAWRSARTWLACQALAGALLAGTVVLQQLLPGKQEVEFGGACLPSCCLALQCEQHWLLEKLLSWAGSLQLACLTLPEAHISGM